MAKRKARPTRRKRQAPKTSKRLKRTSVAAATRKLERAIARLDQAKLALKNAQRSARGLKRSIKKPKLAKIQKHETRSLNGALDFLQSLVGEGKKKTVSGKRAATRSTKKKAQTRSRGKPKGSATPKQPPLAKIAPRITTRKLKSGEIRTIAFDVPYKNLEQWLHDLESNPTLDGQIPEGAQLGFRFFGNNSYQTYKSVKDALLRIGAYESTLRAIYDRPEDQLDVYRNVEFTLIEQSAISQWQGFREERVQAFEAARKGRKRKASRYKRTYWERTKERNPARYKQMLERKRAKAKARYQRLKHDPLFKAKAAAAARKYYRSNKGG